jgi:hypothetical protein
MTKDELNGCKQGQLADVAVACGWKPLRPGLPPVMDARMANKDALITFLLKVQDQGFEIIVGEDGKLQAQASSGDEDNENAVVEDEGGGEDEGGVPSGEDLAEGEGEPAADPEPEPEPAPAKAPKKPRAASAPQTADAQLDDIIARLREAHGDIAKQHGMIERLLTKVEEQNTVITKQNVVITRIFNAVGWLFTTEMGMGLLKPEFFDHPYFDPHSPDDYTVGDGESEPEPAEEAPKGTKGKGPSVAPSTAPKAAKAPQMPGAVSGATTGAQSGGAKRPQLPGTKK